MPLQGPHPWMPLPMAHGPLPPYLCVFLHSTLWLEIHWAALPSHHLGKSTEAGIWPFHGDLIAPCPTLYSLIFRALIIASKLLLIPF